MSEEEVRVSFSIKPATWHKVSVERLWAEPLGNNRYRLLNSPYYASGVSFEDVVLAPGDVTGEPVFASVAARGGHSTYRIIATGSRGSSRRALFEQHWAPLQKLGCTYESDQGLFTVDVPPATNIFEAYAALQAGERAGVWDFQEGHCGHAVG